MSAAWSVYLVRCADGSLYAGITTDVERRVAQHNGEQPGGARYTRARRPVELAHREDGLDRSAAARREAELKRTSRSEKLALCVPPKRAKRARKRRAQSKA
jgi:putative endonuclease